ncbi:MAG: GPP34 family phosphoprotein [Myxococcota bacterium]
MLSLPESLLLFSLHDERGTVHSAAFLGLDEALYAAVLGELMLRGTVRIRSDGALKVPPDAPDSESLIEQLAYKALSEASPDTVDAALEALRSGLGSLRSRLLTAVAAKGIVRSAEIDRENLEDSQVHPTADAGPEAQMVAHVREGIAAGPAVSRRIGLLIGLVHALNLWDKLLPKEERAAARSVGAWVHERDAVCKAAAVSIAKADGSWEG